MTLLHEFKDRIALALTFDYGSNHNRREIECARWQCRLLGIRHVVIELGFMQRYFKSSLLEGSDAIPEADYAPENMKSTVVPFRNGIMLSVACGFAENEHLKYVMIANHGGDHAIYPDCRESFILAMSSAMHEGTYDGVLILAPYTNLSKREIAVKGKALGVDYGHTYSCYKGEERHCGKCGTCREREEALRFAGISPE